MDPVVEEVNHLRCRNAVLETELRMVKEQLVQAQISTSYLINTLSMQQHGCQSAEFSRLKGQLEAVSAENDQLKVALGINSRSQLDSGPSAQRPFAVRGFYQGQCDLLKNPQQGLPSPSPIWSQQPSIDLASDDLLSFDEDSLPSMFCNKQEKISPHPTENGQKIFHSDGSTSFVINTEPEDPFEIYSDPGAPPYSATPSAPIPTNRSPDPAGIPAYRRKFLPLAPWQHKLLLNNCCFLEDMDEAERDEKFEQFALERGRSASAWKHYFEETVWPEYLARKQRMAVEVSSDEELVAEITADGLGGETPSVVETSEQTKSQDVPLDASRSLQEPRDTQAVLVGAEVLAAPSSGPESEDAQVLLDAAQGLHASRWAPKPDVVEGPIDSARRAASAVAPITAEMQDSNVGSSQQRQHAATDTALQSSTGCRPVRGRSGGDPRPSCCKLPHDVKQLFHSNYEHDPATLRTVQISNVPTDITLAKILEQVKGGEIHSAVYIETSKLKVKPLIRTDLVFVTFLDAEAAKSFVEDASKNWIYYHFEKWNCPIKATVSFVEAPTRQISPRELEKISRYNQTRILYIVDNNTLSPTKAEDLLLDFDHELKPAIKCGRNQHGAVVLEYASIANAVKARVAVDSMPWDFDGMEAGFLPDPCGTSAPSSSGMDEQNHVVPQSAMAGAAEKIESQLRPALSTSASHYTTDGLYDNPKLQQAKLESAAQVPRVNPWATSGDLEFAKEMARSFKTNYARPTAVVPPHARVQPRLLPDHMVKSAAEEEEDDVMGREG